MAHEICGEPSTEYSSGQPQCSTHGQRLREHCPRFPCRCILQCWWSPYEMNDEKTGSLVHTLFIQGCPGSYHLWSLPTKLLILHHGFSILCLSKLYQGIFKQSGNGNYIYKKKFNTKYFPPYESTENQSVLKIILIYLWIFCALSTEGSAIFVGMIVPRSGEQSSGSCQSFLEWS